MSGCSDSRDCPKCGGKDTLMTYDNYKPYDTVSGECIECGFEYHTVGGQMGLDEVNEMRTDRDLEPITRLKAQTQ